MLAPKTQILNHVRTVRCEVVSIEALTVIPATVGVYFGIAQRFQAQSTYIL